MEMKNLLVAVMVWQVASAQDDCTGLKLSTGIGGLLGNIPISNCAPDLPTLPNLPYGGCSSYLPSLPSLGDCGCSSYLPSLPSLGDCSSLPSLPSLPDLGGCDDYPYFPEPLPYLKKKCGCAKLSPCFKPTPYEYLKPCGLKPCGLKTCALKECASKVCDYKEKCADAGLGLKIIPHIKPFLLKKKPCEFGAPLSDLPCELPSLVSNVFSGSLNGDCFY